MEQQVDVVLDSIRSSMIELGQFLPKLIGAVIVLIVGWLIAKLLQFVVVRGLTSVGFGLITDKAGLDGFLKKGGVGKGAIEVLGMLVYWLAILLTLLTTFNLLGLTVVSELLGRVTEFIPNVIVAVLVLTIGLYFARFVSEGITAYTRNVGMENAAMLGKVAYYAIAVFVFVVALGQMRIADGILYPAVLIVFAGVIFALALAFGLGGQKWAADRLEKWGKKK